MSSAPDWQPFQDFIVELAEKGGDLIRHGPESAPGTVGTKPPVDL